MREKCPRANGDQRERQQDPNKPIANNSLDSARDGHVANQPRWHSRSAQRVADHHFLLNQDGLRFR
jgi:hypothetical protein